MITIQPLEQQLKSRGMTKKSLYMGAGLSKITMDRLTRGQNASLETIGRICRFLGCGIDQVIRYIPDDSAEANQVRAARAKRKRKVNRDKPVPQDVVAEKYWPGWDIYDLTCNDWVEPSEYRYPDIWLEVCADMQGLEVV